MAEIPQPQMNVFIDTNVVLDVLLKRHPFYDSASAIHRLIYQKQIRGYLSAASITDIFYFVYKDRRDTDLVYRIMDKLTSLLSVAPVSEETIADALALRWKDFEDSVQYIVGKALAADYIITRNTQDFSAGDIPAVTPEQFVQIVTDPE